MQVSVNRNLFSVYPLFYFALSHLAKFCEHHNGSQPRGVSPVVGWAEMHLSKHRPHVEFTTDAIELPPFCCPSLCYQMNKKVLHLLTMTAASDNDLPFFILMLWLLV